MGDPEVTLQDIAALLAAMQAENLSLRHDMTAIQGQLAAGITSPWGTTPSPRVRQEGLLRQPTFTFGGSSTATNHDTAIQVVTPHPVQLAPPERFYGDSTKHGVFIHQCHLHFMARSSPFTDDASKVAFILSYIGGDAAQWSISLVENDDHMLNILPTFKEAMR
ncbi:protein LDOC1-like [Lissotriton helveticus]